VNIGVRLIENGRGRGRSISTTSGIRPARANERNEFAVADRHVNAAQHFEIIETLAQIRYGQLFGICWFACSLRFTPCPGSETARVNLKSYESHNV
jgi:hypothetical protein